MLEYCEHSFGDDMDWSKITPNLCSLLLRKKDPDTLFDVIITRKPKKISKVSQLTRQQIDNLSRQDDVLRIKSPAKLETA